MHVKIHAEKVDREPGIQGEGTGEGREATAIGKRTERGKKAKQGTMVEGGRECVQETGTGASGKRTKPRKRVRNPN